MIDSTVVLIKPGQRFETINIPTHRSTYVPENVIIVKCRDCYRRFVAERKPRELSFEYVYRATEECSEYDEQYVDLDKIEVCETCGLKLPIKPMSLFNESARKEKLVLTRNLRDGCIVL